MMLTTTRQHETRRSHCTANCVSYSPLRCPLHSLQGPRDPHPATGPVTGAIVIASLRVVTKFPSLEGRAVAVNILVAGGVGMIGSHLCETLARAGHDVFCLDNLSTARFENLAILSRLPRFHFIQHDITRELPDLPPPDRIYHLASPASPVGYTRLPIETMLANSEGTRRLCELAIAHQARFLFCSTSEIYGDPLQHPQREDYRGNVSTLGPRAAYDESKRYGEAMTMTFSRVYGLNGRIVRIFN